ncbi:MAG: S8 family peptidase [Flavobacteriales bacterium]
MINILKSMCPGQNPKRNNLRRQSKNGTFKAAVFVLAAAFCITSQAASDQSYVNRQFVVINGQPVDLHWSSTILATSNHILTVGNTQTSGQGANVFLTKQATDGTIIWSVEYDGGFDEFGIAICEDGSGNFLVAATQTGDTSDYDILVLKYSSAGTLLWDYTFNGGQGNDLPASIVAHGNEAIITGGKETSNGLSDIVTIRLDASGSELWAETYDQNNLHDIGVQVNVDQSTGEATVVGGSSPSVNSYEKVVLRYDEYGSLTDQYHSSATGIDKPTCMGSDSINNTIVGGYYTLGTGLIEMVFISLDDTLGLNWSITHSPADLENKVNDMSTNYIGESFATGYVKESTGEYSCWTAMISATGSIEWEQTYQVAFVGGAMGKRITLDSEGHVNVAGIEVEGTDTSLLILQYDHDGNLNFAQTYDSGYNEIATGIMAGPGGSIYVSGTSTANGNGYMTVKYNTFRRAYLPVDSGNYKFVDNEIIVQFKPSVAIGAAYGTNATTFGLLSEFVDQGVINEINSIFGDQYDFGRFNTVKVFRRLTNADTLSVSRQGDTIRMHHFWTTLALQIPEALSELVVANVMNDSMNASVAFAELNLIGELMDLPDDTHFTNGDQDGLESSNFNDNDIEMDRAWDIYKGSEYASVGVFDTGIEYQHEDFSKTGQQTFSDSKVINGHNYVNNTSWPATIGDDNGHGSKTAGIIGAIRNNSLGVASVAGGDANQSSYGVNLVDMKITDAGSFNQITLDRAAEAMQDGARDWNENGYSLDVLNHSWGISVGDTLYTDEFKTLFTKVNKFVYDNGAVNVCARGNNGNTDDVFPAQSGPDHFTLCAGGSGTNGDKHSSSSYGIKMDIIAPGVSSLVYSTYLADGYATHSGTSAAAPHVAGVAALLTSQANDPNRWVPHRLDHDDVENLIQNYATDIQTPTPTYQVGYDINSGHGRLNAGLVMEHMEWPYYWVKHVEVDFSNAFAEVLSSVQFGDQLVLVKEDFDYPGTVNDLGEGYYFADIYLFEIAVNHSIGGAQLLGGWIRNASGVSNMLSSDPEIYDIPFAHLDSVSPTKAFVHGHVFHIKKDTSNNTVDKWLPFDPFSNIRFGYSLHLYDSNATGIEQTEEISKELVAWPNPASNFQNLTLPEGESVNADLIDMQGRVLQTVFHGEIKSSTTVTVNLESLESGVYFYRVTADEQNHTLRFVKCE